MSQLKLDESEWMVCENEDGTYRVGSVGTRRVFAPSVTLALGTQIVDEHVIALRLTKLMRERQGTPLETLDGFLHRRTAL